MGRTGSQPGWSRRPETGRRLDFAFMVVIVAGDAPLAVLSAVFRPASSASFLHFWAAAEKCPVPQKLIFRVEGEIRRDAVGFTQGLEVRDGLLYESTGNFFGDTRINRIDTKTGHVSVLMNAGKSYFGEGMTFFGDRLYQMTYRENQVYVFDKNMRRLPTLSNPREGWGLTHDESH